VIEPPDERPPGQPLIEVEGGVAGAGFRAVAEWCGAFRPTCGSQLARATADTADDVRLELEGGASVVWGSAEDSALKATVLAALMRAAPPDTVAQYDVSAPTSPVTSERRRLLIADRGRTGAGWGSRRADRSVLRRRFATRGASLPSRARQAPTFESGIAYSAKL
jgi:hypothetical protein